MPLNSEDAWNNSAGVEDDFICTAIYLSGSQGVEDLVIFDILNKNILNITKNLKPFDEN